VAPSNPRNPGEPSRTDDEDLRTLLLDGTDPELDQFFQILREPADLAECILLIPDVERRRHVFSRLDPEIASEVLAELDDDEREPLMALFATHELARLVDGMETDDAADVLGDLPPERVTQVLEGLPDEEEREEVRRLLDYPEDSAGGIMQLELVAVPERATVAAAIEALRSEADEVGDINVVFVTDDAGHPVGSVPLVRLVLTPDNAEISSIVDRDTPVIGVTEDQEEVARLFQKYDLIAAPVADEQGRLVGRITIDDIVDVIEEEAEEDLLIAVGADEADLSYGGGNIIRISGVRLAWLLANLLGGLVAAWLISLFTDTLTDALALVAFIPVIMAMGGNVGIQTSTITIRGIATGRIRRDNSRTVFLRELSIGIFMGLVCGLALAAVAGFWKGDPWIGLVVGLAMFVAILVASFVGAVLPALLRMVDIDPAIAAGPVVTTAIDILGILIYFLIAVALLSYVR
jgi:magnesium transporter